MHSPEPVRTARDCCIAGSLTHRRIDRPHRQASRSLKNSLPQVCRPGESKHIRARTALWRKPSAMRCSDTLEVSRDASDISRQHPTFVLVCINMFRAFLNRSILLSSFSRNIAQAFGLCTRTGM